LQRAMAVTSYKRRRELSTAFSSEGNWIREKKGKSVLLSKGWERGGEGGEESGPNSPESVDKKGYSLQGRKKRGREKVHRPTRPIHTLLEGSLKKEKGSISVFCGVGKKEVDEASFSRPKSNGGGARPSKKGGNFSSYPGRTRGKERLAMKSLGRIKNEEKLNIERKEQTPFLRNSRKTKGGRKSRGWQRVRSGEEDSRGDLIGTLTEEGEGAVIQDENEEKGAEEKGKEGEEKLSAFKKEGRGKRISTVAIFFSRA